MDLLQKARNYRLFFLLLSLLRHSICMEPGAFCYLRGIICSSHRLQPLRRNFSETRICGCPGTRDLDPMWPPVNCANNPPSRSVARSWSNHPSGRSDGGFSGRRSSLFTSHINGAPLYITAFVLLCIACTKHLALRLLFKTICSLFLLVRSEFAGCLHQPPPSSWFCHCNALFTSLARLRFSCHRCQWQAIKQSDALESSFEFGVVGASGVRMR
jgi:hypothetical protein